MARPTAVPAEEKTRIVLSILAGEVSVAEGPYPRMLDTGCDYAAVGSVAARRAS